MGWEGRKEGRKEERKRKEETDVRERVKMDVTTRKSW